MINKKCTNEALVRVRKLTSHSLRSLLCHFPVRQPGCQIDRVRGLALFIVLLRRLGDRGILGVLLRLSLSYERAGLGVLWLGEGRLVLRQGCW
eukprot:1869895-Pyramimonas_sp.AAC.1